MAKVPQKEILLWLFYLLPSYEHLVLYSFLNMQINESEKRGSRARVKINFRASELIGTDHPLCFRTTVHFKLCNIIPYGGNMKSLPLF